ncbi:MAG: hypothetical protein JMDDDDMK_04973 [Acidobacteria bacterium]|nr:hypothetical protein [Acidobacteriota bacterium]
MKRLSRPSASGFADTAGGNPFAVFEIIADARSIRRQSHAAEVIESANRIELHADGMIKTILGTADLSTLEVPDSVIEQIVETLRPYRQ